MNATNRGRRHYMTTDLPTLRGEFDIAQNKDLLIALFGEVCSAWRELVEVRFKLLAIVPSVTFVLLVAILSTTGPTAGLSQPSRLLISVFGLVVTFGLFVYDTRNSELHDDLISRGRKIEEELGVDTGIFLGRRTASGVIKHDVATGVIYGSSALAWLVAIVFLIRHW